MQKLENPKTCSCGAVHFVLPSNSRVMSDGSPLSGVYFECGECHSTLFVPMKEAA